MKKSKNASARICAALLGVLLLCMPAMQLIGCTVSAQAIDLTEGIQRGTAYASSLTDAENAAAVDFAVRLFQNTVQDGETLLLSPFSVLCALGMTANGAQGETLRGSGAELARAARADFDGLDARLARTQIEVICDVTNPLLGPDGATVVYGPQKGVTPAMSTALEAGMANYAALLENTLGRDVSRFPGAGAAGGMGAALGGVLGARLKKGIDAVLDAVDFDARIAGCDAVFTGEGRIDRQSVAFGKATAGVARRCRKQDVPVIAIVGGMGPGAEAFYDEGRVSIFTTVNGPMTVETAIKNAAPLYRDAARRAFQTLAIGRGLK